MGTSSETDLEISTADVVFGVCVLVVFVVGVALAFWIA